MEDLASTKLLYVTNQISGSGGLERILAEKTKWLLDNNSYLIHIITLNDDENLSPFFTFHPNIIRHNLLIKSFNIYSYAAYFREINRIIKKIQPDIITVCDDGLKGLLFPLFIQHEGKIIYERHASKALNLPFQNPGFKKLGDVVYAWLASKFDIFIVLTEGNSKEWSVKNTLVIPNPISQLPKGVSSQENKRIIVVGAHSPNKGYDMLINIWQQVQPSFPDWELHVYGDMDPQLTYPRLVKRKKLSKIYFHGAVKNIWAKYLESSILLSTSRSEGFGIVLIEAMACGLPCIAFDCPSGPADIISHGENGFLIKLNDIQSYVDKTKLLIENNEIRLKMSEKARQNSLNYLPDQINEQWNRLYIKLLRTQPSESYS
ncbi:glycosyltransferase family 4 protein [Robertkochia marina]|uniref:Glycosyltransferase family 4 protein n=1 Tax=Robertkochia marina TaxID=1227945 RepID=A0A4S3LYU5_9FLAO|nr:glycosyltransferase [Robertkochia marina]THD66779.1 glycosyltransferase family 4 protein [Robertkochia marina]TRZ41930.1 glycosyltransferase family 4 protein [Robertkochia marina]